MWISQDRFDELCREVRDLRERVQRLGERPSEPTMVFYPGEYISAWSRKEVGVTTVVWRILSHLGLRLDHNPGVEPHTTLTPIRPAVMPEAKPKKKR